MSLGKSKLLGFKNFTRVPDGFQKLALEGLTLNGFRVLLYLFSNSEGFHPSIERIAKETGLLPSAITRTLKDLIDGGFIKRARLGNSRMKKTTIYDLNPTIQKLIALRPSKKASEPTYEPPVNITQIGDITSIQGLLS